MSAQKSLFRLQNIKDCDDLIKFYTGFPDYTTLIAAYKILLESDASGMQQWHGKHCPTVNLNKVDLRSKFFLTLMRLRLGLFELDLVNRFGILQSTISYSTVVLYIRDHGELGFPSQKIHPNTSFTTPSWHLGSIG